MSEVYKLISKNVYKYPKIICKVKMIFEKFAKTFNFKILKIVCNTFSNLVYLVDYWVVYSIDKMPIYVMHEY